MRGDIERGKDRESGRRDGKEDWGLGKRGIVEQREDRKRVEVVRAYGAEGQVVYEFNLRSLTHCHVKAMIA